jgi:flagellar biosynthesis component FlhA
MPATTGAAQATGTQTQTQTQRPLTVSILAVYSWILGIITAIPQFYYVLFAIHLVTIGPHSNFLGYI